MFGNYNEDPFKDDDPFRKEYYKKETRIRTIKSWIFFGIIVLVFLIAELIIFIRRG